MKPIQRLLMPGVMLCLTVNSSLAEEIPGLAEFARDAISVKVNVRAHENEDAARVSWWVAESGSHELIEAVCQFMKKLDVAPTPNHGKPASGVFIMVELSNGSDKFKVNTTVELVMMPDGKHYRIKDVDPDVYTEMVFVRDVVKKFPKEFRKKE